jgi:hypothetical protein
MNKTAKVFGAIGTLKISDLDKVVEPVKADLAKKQGMLQKQINRIYKEIDSMNNLRNKLQTELYSIDNQRDDLSQIQRSFKNVNSLLNKHAAVQVKSLKRQAEIQQKARKAMRAAKAVQKG